MQTINFYGIFPNASKVAKLKPVFKNSKEVDTSNYRPSSLLALIPKFTEKVAHDQTKEFLSDNRILWNYQFEFRTNHWANLGLSFLTDRILRGFDESFLTGMILIDLQKFDTINHEVL